MVWRGKARKGAAKQARLGGAGQGLDWRSKSGKERTGTASRGEAWRSRRGKARTGKAGLGIARRDTAKQAGQGLAGQGTAKQSRQTSGDSTALTMARASISQFIKPTFLKGNTMSKSTESLVIPAPNFQTAEFLIRGTAPYVQHKFSQKSRKQMMDTQSQGAKAKNKKTKEPRDFEADYKGAMHLTAAGEHGIPAPAFRSAMISACRVAGFQMTKAKLSVFVEPDGFDADDGTPLVHIIGKPRMHEASVRLESGVASIAVRPMWDTWEAIVRVRWDGDQFGVNDVGNLLMRAGMQVGVGEGRPDSKKSHGMGWGTFEIVEK